MIARTTLYSLFGIVFLFFFSNPLFAQRNKVKFGKVTSEELSMTNYEKDATAAAVILFDKGRTTFDYHTSQGFKTTMKRHLRIKIFKQTGFDWGDFSIPFYESPRGNVKVVGLKAATTYMEGNKTLTEKLDKSAVFEEETSKYWRLQKFSMPKLSEGCVIDITYELVSDFYYNLPEWQFQYTIPVLWSEYEVEVPEYFSYNKNVSGYVPMQVYDQTTSSGSFSFTTRNQTNSSLEPTNKQNYEKVNFRNEISFYGVADVPALKEEPYTSSIDNFYTKIEFELSYTDFPGSPRENYSAKWETIDEDLLFDSKFGAQTNKSAFFKNEIATIQGEHTEPLAQVVAIYELIKKKVKWNKEYSIYANTGINKALKDGFGNVADINLMLTAALKNAGFNAAPIVLSTRNHGFIPLTRPSLTCFNYVITSVEVDGKALFLDATSRPLPAGTLPTRCLNGKGRLIQEAGSLWISFNKPEKYDVVTQYEVEIDENQAFKGKLKGVYKGYAAIDFRDEVANSGSESDYIEDFQKSKEDFQINSSDLSYTDIYEKATETHDIVYANGINTAGDLIYMNPMLDEAITENPFKAENRTYPVDFAYPRKETYVFKVTIPEGYALEELPEKGIITLPEKVAKYTYTAVLTGNQLTIISKLEINKTLFLPEEYPFLREFYDLLIEKQAEQIVLKKA